MFLKFKYTLIIFAAIIALTSLTSHAQDSDTGEGKWVEVSPPSAPQVLVVPQTETIQDFVIPSDGQEPAPVDDTSGKIGVEGKIIQLEQKINQLIYLNAIVLLLIVVTAGSFGFVKMRKKLLEKGLKNTSGI